MGRLFKKLFGPCLGAAQSSHQGAQTLAQATTCACAAEPASAAQQDARAACSVTPASVTLARLPTSATEDERCLHRQVASLVLEMDGEPFSSELSSSMGTPRSPLCTVAQAQSENGTLRAAYGKCTGSCIAPGRPPGSPAVLAVQQVARALSDVSCHQSSPHAAAQPSLGSPVQPIPVEQLLQAGSGSLRAPPEALGSTSRSLSSLLGGVAAGRGSAGDRSVRSEAGRGPLVSILCMHVEGYQGPSDPCAPPMPSHLVTRLLSMFNNLCVVYGVHRIRVAGSPPCFLASSVKLLGNPGGEITVNPHTSDDGVGTRKLMAFAKDLLSSSGKMLLLEGGEQLAIRIGMATGACGGSRDEKSTVLATITTALRMERTCSPGSVQLSPAAFATVAAGRRSESGQWSVGAGGNPIESGYLWRMPASRPRMMPGSPLSVTKLPSAFVPMRACVPPASGFPAVLQRTAAFGSDGSMRGLSLSVPRNVREAHAASPYGPQGSLRPATAGQTAMVADPLGAGALPPPPPPRLPEGGYASEYFDVQLGGASATSAPYDFPRAGEGVPIPPSETAVSAPSAPGLGAGQDDAPGRLRGRGDAPGRADLGHERGDGGRGNAGRGDARLGDAGRGDARWGDAGRSDARWGNAGRGDAPDQLDQPTSPAARRLSDGQVQSSCIAEHPSCPKLVPASDSGSPVGSGVLWGSGVLGAPAWPGVAAGSGALGAPVRPGMAAGSGAQVGAGLPALLCAHTYSSGGGMTFASGRATPRKNLLRAAQRAAGLLGPPFDEGGSRVANATSASASASPSASAPAPDSASPVGSMELQAALIAAFSQPGGVGSVGVGAASVLFQPCPELEGLGDLAAAHKKGERAEQGRAAMWGLRGCKGLTRGSSAI